MKIITKQYKVYTYDELTINAKEKVNNWYLQQDFRTEVFTEHCNELLKYYFDADLHVQYSLSYCQGDGLNIYGKIFAEDILNFLDKNIKSYEEFKNCLTEKEKQTILCYANECGDIKLEQNNRYCYSLAGYIDIKNEWEYQLQNYSHFKNINIKLLEKFEKITRDIFDKLCSNFEDDGYKYFYDADEEEIKDFCHINNYEFLEDGTIYK